MYTFIKHSAYEIDKNNLLAIATSNINELRSNIGLYSYHSAS